MRISDREKKWAIAIFALITSLGLIVAFAVPQNIAWILLIGLGILQYLLIWIRKQVVQVLYQNQHLQHSYEREISFAEQIMKDIDHGITVSDETGRFIYVNQAYANLTGLTPSELIGHTLFEFTSPDTHQTLQNKLILHKKGQRHSYTTVLRHIDGHQTKVLISGSPRWHEGRMVGYFLAIMPLSTLIDHPLKLEQSKTTIIQQFPIKLTTEH